jgi:hypothetical protein
MGCSFDSARLCDLGVCRFRSSQVQRFGGWVTILIHLLILCWGMDNSSFHTYSRSSNTKPSLQQGTETGEKKKVNREQRASGLCFEIEQGCCSR